MKLTSTVFGAAIKRPALLILSSALKSIGSVFMLTIMIMLAGSTAIAQTWTTTGTAGFSAGGAGHTSIAINPGGTPYVVYQDSGNSNKATVMMYNGSSWVLVGSAGFSAGAAAWPAIAINASGTPYVVYADGGNSSKATVMQYNGSSWVTVGSAGFSAGSVNFTTIAINASGTPYVAYTDAGHSLKATVMEYNGSSWVTVGSAGFSAGSENYTSIAINAGGTPYVAYQDQGNGGKATVMQYNGSSWVTTGAAGFSAGTTAWESLAINASGTPYVAYEDEGNADRVTVMQYNGDSWVAVGTAGFTSAAGTNYVSIAINTSGTPYVVYKDSREASVMEYNGSSWVFTGNEGFSAGIGYYSTIAISASGTLYVVYSDGGNSYAATVMDIVPCIAGVVNAAAQTVCPGNATPALGATTGSAGTATYAWTVQSHTTGIGTYIAGAFSNAASPTATYTPAMGWTGTVLLKLTTTNSCLSGGTSSITVTLNVVPIPAVTAASELYCSGSSAATLTAAGGYTGLTTYSWSPATYLSGTTGATTTSTPTVFPSSTTYTVTATTPGCPTYTTTATVTAAQPPSPACPANVTQAADAGSCGAVVTYGAATATGTPPITYAYSMPSGVFFPDGTTQVTVDATNECGTNDCSFNVAITPNTISVSITETDATCNGSSSGSINAIAGGGSGSYTYSWTNSAGTTWTAGGGSQTGLPSDYYLLVVTDNTCNDPSGVIGNKPFSTYVYVGEPDPVSVALTPVDASCNTGNGGYTSNGSITAVPSGGSLYGYTYSWNDPGAQTSSEATGLAAGAYTVTVHDANSCVGTGSASVGEPDLLTVSATSTAVSCNTANGGNHNNGTISTTTTGGSGGNEYSYYSTIPGAGYPEFGFDPTTFPASTYTVTVTDIHTCTATTVAVVGQPDPLSATLTPANISCNNANGGTHNDGSISTSVTGGTSTYSYTWFDGISTPNHTGLTATATYSVIVTDANSCTASGSAIVGQPDAFLATAGDESVCAGTNVTLPGLPSGGTWSVTNPYNNSTPGSYSYTYTYTNGSGCTAGATSNITDNAVSAITSATSASSPICPSGSTDITANGVAGTAATLTWYTGPGGTGTNLGSTNPLSAGPGTYYADVTGACGATAEASVIVASYTNVSITSATSAASPICPSGSTDITANGVAGTAATLTWYTGPGGTGTNLGSTNPLSAGPGTYYADVTGACGATAETSVTVDAYTNVGITSATSAASPICPSGSTNITANGIAGTAATLTWWTGSGGTGTNLGNSNPLSVGPGTYYADVTGTCGATAETSVTVDAYTNVGITSASSAASPICPSGSTNITANGVAGTAAALTWWTGAGGTGTNLGNSNPLSAGPGTYYADVTGTCGAAAEASVVVGSYTNVSITSATAAASPICSFLTTTLTANDVSGTGASVTWYTGSGGTGTNLGIANPLTAGPGTYYAYVTGTCGTAQASVTVGADTYPGIPSVVATVSSLCPGGTTTITASGITGTGATLTWWAGGVGTGTNLGSANPLTVGPGTYYAYVNATCAAAETSVTVGSNTNAGITSATAAASPICPSGSTNITANSVSGTGATLTWYTGSGATGTNLGSANPLSAGPGTYYADVTGTCGATAEASVTVGSFTNVGITSATSAASPICPGTTTNITANGIAGTGTTLNWWTGSGGTGTNLGSANPLSVGPGTYYAYVTGTCGTPAQALVVVGSNTVPAITSATATVISVCPGGTTTISASGVTGTGASLTWWTGTGGTGTNLGSATSITEGPGTYYAYVTGTCGTAQASATVGTSALPTVSISSSGNLTCTATSATLTASGASTYTWAGSSSISSTRTVTAAGTYTVTGTGSDGCHATATYTETLTTTPLATPTVTVTNNCGSSTLTAAGIVSGATITWSPAGSGNPLTVTTSGSYTATQSLSGCASSASTAVTAAPGSGLTLTPAITNVSCYGGSTGSISVAASGGSGSSTYSWSPCGGTSASITGKVAGTYTVTVTNGSCHATGIYTITQPSAALAVSGTVTNVTCNGGDNGSITTSVTGGIPSYTYSWSPCGSATATLTGKAAGTYDVTVTDAHGCTTTRAYTITQPAALSLTATITNASCTGCGNGGITTTVSGGTPVYSYVWSDGLHIADPAALAAGTYSVTVTDANGCAIKGSYCVTQPTTKGKGGRMSAGDGDNTTGNNTGILTDIRVIPNPNNGIFTIKGTLGTTEDEEISIQIVDMLGQVIYNSKVSTQNGEINQQVQLNGSIANGMYVLSLSSGNQNNAFHIIVAQ